MGTTVATGATKLTYDDLLAMPNDGRRHELIAGEHFVTAAPNVRHQLVLQNINLPLATFVRAGKLGQVFVARFDVVLGPLDVVEPDLLYLSQARLHLLTAANAQGPPDLAIEILSPSTRRRDEVLKVDLFERAGISEYWLVDPDAETVKVFRCASDERYGRPILLTLREGDVLTTPLLPGFALALTDVFAD